MSTPTPAIKATADRQLREKFEQLQSAKHAPKIAAGLQLKNADGSFQVSSIEMRFRAWADGYRAALAPAAIQAAVPAQPTQPQPDATGCERIHPPELPKFMPDFPFASMQDCWDHAVLTGWRAAQPQQVEVAPAAPVAPDLASLLQELREEYQTVIDSAYCQADANEDLLARVAAALAHPVAQAPVSDLQGQLNAMRSAFHQNMLRAFPDKSHEEIAAEIDRAVPQAPVEPQLDPVAETLMRAGESQDDAIRMAAAGRATLVEPVSEDKRDAERLRPADEYHEDYHDVLWFAFPSFCEPPQCYVGSPLEVSPEFDSDHWTHFIRLDFNDIIGQAERLAATPSTTKEST
jgi:hypothetical protein